LRALFPALILLSLLASCGAHHGSAENEEAAGFGTSANLILTVEKHAPGWQRPDCFSCHIPKNLHLENANTLPGINLDQVRQIVDKDGEASCHRCHGPNGL
jgi:hypothetical protein